MIGNMVPNQDLSPSERATASSTGGGCLPGFLLPPLVAVLGGVGLMFFAFSPMASPAEALVPMQTTATSQGYDSTSQALPGFTVEVQSWSGRIKTWAAAAGLDPKLAATVMQMESCGDPQARSRAGAMGLFQVMPYHFIAGEDPYDPDTNALRGMDYLRRSLTAANGDAHLALAGYNGGIGVISEPESTWPSETIHYAKWGNLIYQDAVNGTPGNPALNEWLAANGGGLCRQAHTSLGLTP